MVNCKISMCTENVYSAFYSCWLYSVLYKIKFLGHVVQFFCIFTETGILKFSTVIVDLSVFFVLRLCYWVHANLELLHFLHFLDILSFYHCETFFYFLVMLLALKAFHLKVCLHLLYLGLYLLHISLIIHPCCLIFKMYLLYTIYCWIFLNQLLLPLSFN